MKNFNQINTILFDLDGTLINTEKEFYDSFYEVLKSDYDITINEKLYKECELDKNATLLNVLRNNNKVIKSITNDEIMNKVFNCYEKKFITTITSNNAIKKFEYLKLLKDYGYILGLVTTCSKKYLDILMKQLNIHGLFDCIIAREDVKKLKPNCEAYMKALSLLGKVKDEVLAVEDSKRGIEAALKTGLTVVKVDEFTLVKFKEEKCLEFNSVDELVKQILERYV